MGYRKEIEWLRENTLKLNIRDMLVEKSSKETELENGQKRIELDKKINAFILVGEQEYSFEFVEASSAIYGNDGKISKSERFEQMALLEGDSMEPETHSGSSIEKKDLVPGSIVKMAQKLEAHYKANESLYDAKNLSNDAAQAKKEAKEASEEFDRAVAAYEKAKSDLKMDEGEYLKHQESMQRFRALEDVMKKVCELAESESTDVEADKDSISLGSYYSKLLDQVAKIKKVIDVENSFMMQRVLEGISDMNSSSREDVSTTMKFCLQALRLSKIDALTENMVAEERDFTEVDKMATEIEFWLKRIDDEIERYAEAEKETVSDATDLVRDIQKQYIDMGLDASFMKDVGIHIRRANKYAEENPGESPTKQALDLFKEKLEEAKGYKFEVAKEDKQDRAQAIEDLFAMEPELVELDFIMQDTRDRVALFEVAKVNEEGQVLYTRAAPDAIFASCMDIAEKEGVEVDRKQQAELNLALGKAPDPVSFINLLQKLGPEPQDNLVYFAMSKQPEDIERIVNRDFERTQDMAMAS